MNLQLGYNIIPAVIIWTYCRLRSVLWSILCSRF